MFTAMKAVIPGPRGFTRWACPMIAPEQALMALA